MSSSVDTYDAAVLENAARSAARTHLHSPRILARYGSAGNDASCTEAIAEPTIYADENELEAWARHAFGANGFGDAAIAPAAPPSLPPGLGSTSLVVARRSLYLGTMIAEALRKVAEAGRQALARRRERRRMWVVHDALRQLNDNVLRDLGFHRSELMSIATEVSGGAQRTRVRDSHVLPFGRFQSRPDW